MVYSIKKLLKVLLNKFPNVKGPYVREDESRITSASTFKCFPYWKIEIWNGPLADLSSSLVHFWNALREGREGMEGIYFLISSIFINRTERLKNRRKVFNANEWKRMRRKGPFCIYKRGDGNTSHVISMLRLDVLLPTTQSILVKCWAEPGPQ